MHEPSGYIVEEYWIGQRSLDCERKSIKKKIDAAPARVADETCGYCEGVGESIRLRRLLATVHPVRSVWKPRNVMTAWSGSSHFAGPS
jgi:hypothetical protein